MRHRARLLRAYLYCQTTYTCLLDTRAYNEKTQRTLHVKSFALKQDDLKGS